MTVAVINNRAQYTGTGSVDTFAYGFKIFEDSDLEVYLDDTLQTLSTHYSVTGAGSDSGGNVVFVTPPANGVKVTIIRTMPLTQLTDYTAYDAFPAETHESALDRLTFISQQLAEELGRCLQLDPTSTITFPPFIIPETAAERENKVLAFSDDGAQIEIGQELGTYRGDWVTATGYNKRDIFKDPANDNIYWVNQDYTSGASVAADVAGGKVDLLVDSASATASAAAAAASAAAAAASESAAAASESAAAGSESAAATSASNASSSASAASTSASNAATSETNAALEKTYAEEWAQKAEDSPVSVAAGGDGSTEFSALHWAAKAAASAASADYLTHANSVQHPYLNVENEWSKQQGFNQATLTYAATVNWDCDNQVVQLTLAGNPTIAAPTNVQQGTFYHIRVVQDATGGRVPSWNAAYKWPGGSAITLSTAANSVDRITFCGGASNTLEYVGHALDIS